jgi:acyl-CoA synthetase (AMP-forming)/AMP-acid ligase II
MPDFIALDALVGQSATIAPDRIAVIDGERELSYAALDNLIDRIAAALQGDGATRCDLHWRHHPRKRVTQCSRASVMEARSLGVLGTPLSRSVTAV